MGLDRALRSMAATPRRIGAVVDMVAQGKPRPSWHVHYMYLCEREPREAPRRGYAGHRGIWRISRREPLTIGKIDVEGHG